MEQPILKYRVLFENHFEDFTTVDEAWARRCDHVKKTGFTPYVHTIRLGGPEFPILD